MRQQQPKGQLWSHLASLFYEEIYRKTRWFLVDIVYDASFGVIRCNMAALSAIQLHCTSLDCTDRHWYAGTKWLKTPHMHRPFLLSNCQLYNEKLMLRENYPSAYSYFFLFLSCLFLLSGSGVGAWASGADQRPGSEEKPRDRSALVEPSPGGSLTFHLCFCFCSFNSN